MRRELVVHFGPDKRIAVALHADEAPMQADAARRWLDEEFLANDCEPVRASGKVLIVDKVLVLASTAGEARFAEDAAWAHDFARAALAALGRPVVQVDVIGGAVSC